MQVAGPGAGDRSGEGSKAGAKERSLGSHIESSENPGRSVDSCVFLRSSVRRRLSSGWDSIIRWCEFSVASGLAR